MALILRQSTAVDVLIGPFLDLTDGATAEEGESPTVLLSKNGQALGAKADVTVPVHDDAGYYNCELDATDSNTVGTLVLIVEKSATALPVRHEFQVIEEAIFDSLYAASAAAFDASQRVDVGKVAGTAQTANDIGADVDAILLDTGTDGVVIPQAQADKVWGTAARALTDKAGFALSAAGIQAIWDALVAALVTVGSVGKLLVDNINATISSRSSHSAANVKTAVEAAGSHLALIKAVTDKADSALELDGAVYRFTTNALEQAPTGGSAPTALAIADAVWDEDLRDHKTKYSAGSLQAMLSDWDIAGNQLLLDDFEGSVLYTFDLTQDGTPTEFNPDKRAMV